MAHATSHDVIIVMVSQGFAARLDETGMRPVRAALPVRLVVREQTAGPFGWPRSTLTQMAGARAGRPEDSVLPPGFRRMLS